MTPVLELPLTRLATTLAPLRGPRPDSARALAPLPLRVVAPGDGTYEVLDGFKRLAAWTRAGHPQVPVVVEDAPGVVGKARLLEANAPRRTLSPMDEARVVRALADEDQLSPAQMAKLLGRGRGWVDRRLTLGRRLAPAVAAHVDAGRLSATTAYAVAACPRGEQPRLADALTRHGVRTREAEAFLTAWRVAADAATREALLRDPRGAVPAPRAPVVSPLGGTARELQAHFDQTERALADLLSVDLTGLADPDRRVLEACQRRLTAQVVRLARTVQQEEEPAHADARGTRGTPPAPARAHPDPSNGPPARSGRQDDPPSAGPAAPGPATRQARALSRAGQGAVRGGPALAADPARTARAGVYRRRDDPEGLPPHAGPPPPAAPGVPSLRDGPGPRGPVGLEPLPRDDRGPGDGRPRLLHGLVLLAAALRGLLS
jgi:ParB/RepB/Spo0J family partition protein